MLFTGKGDKGTSKLFSSKSGERLSKSSLVFELLGSLDELNSFLGFVRSQLSQEYKLNDKEFSGIVFSVQEDLFIIQAQTAGAEKELETGKTKWLEDIINSSEDKMPKIESFFIPGETKEGALLDMARTITRRVERLAVKATEANEVKLSSQTLSYLNRLSSLFYALARLSNYLAGQREKKPSY